LCFGQLAMGQHVRVVDDDVPLYEPFARAFELHASESAYNAHYDRPAMLELMGDVHGVRVLDVGCGPGLYAEQLIARGAVVTAFDASPEMVRLTRARVGSRVDVRTWDLALPLSWLADGSHDLAVMALVIHHIDNRAQALSEIHRVLRPGGRLYLSTTHPTSDWLLKGGGYFDREQISETWQSDWQLRYWKQPLEAWCAEFSAAGFLIERLVEPRPAESMASAYPDVYRQLMDSPGFIAFALVKPGPAQALRTGMIADMSSEGGAAAEPKPRDAGLGGLAVEPFDARQWPEEQMKALFAEGFPAFITADQEAKGYIGRVREWFPHLNIVLVAQGETPVATGWGVPIRWSGDVADLPSGYTDATRRAVALHEAGGEPDTFVICGGIAHPEHKGSGLASALITALIALSDREGLPRVIAPLRPTLKHRYPLTAIEDYASWTRADGEPFDPWLRTHVRLGGRFIATAPRSQTMTGTVAEWEAWSGMGFPGTGDYVIPGGLSTLHIDRDADEGRYVEPNIWVRHR